MKLYFQLEYLAKLSPKPVHNIAYNTGRTSFNIQKNNQSSNYELIFVFLRKNMNQISVTVKSKYNKE